VSTSFYMTLTEREARQLRSKNAVVVWAEIKSGRDKPNGLAQVFIGSNLQLVKNTRGGRPERIPNRVKPPYIADAQGNVVFRLHPNGTCVVNGKTHAKYSMH